MEHGGGGVNKHQREHAHSHAARVGNHAKPIPTYKPLSYQSWCKTFKFWTSIIGLKDATPHGLRAGGFTDSVSSSDASPFVMAKVGGWSPVNGCWHLYLRPELREIVLSARRSYDLELHKSA